MLACCVSGCTNRHSSSSKLKFYRIPSGSRPFQANRRRLWLRAIRQVNGRTEQIRANARVCGAHFESQEASMDHDSPDFVPSVFACAKQSPKKGGTQFDTGRRKRRRSADTAEMEEETTPPQEIRTPSKEEETKEDETETPSPNKTSPLQASADIPYLDKRIPIVLLKHVFVPAGGYRCEECNQSFTDAPQLLKHKRLHDEEASFVCDICGTSFTSEAVFTEHQCVLEPSFPCNMCDRTFTSNHNLKRHKLLHVKDGRKCRECGVLFCKRHNHVAFMPLAESVTEYEEDSTPTEPQHFYSNLTPDNHLLGKPEPSRTADLDNDAQSTVTVSPIPPKPKILPKTSEPVFIKRSFVPLLPPAVPRFNPGTSQCKTPWPNFPTVFVQPLPPRLPELPPSLKLFSPQFLTSALLKVKRNYEYILSKPNVKRETLIVKEEPCELPLIPPDEQIIKHIKKEQTA